MLPLMQMCRDYFQSEDVVRLAKELIGCYLCTFIQGKLCKGMIIETEAYAGINDKASHAFGGKMTQRTEVMYRQGGTAYVYLCYGLHYLFNIVTAPKGIPHAVLVRSLLPADGIETMKQRRGGAVSMNNLINGPANLAKAMGIDHHVNGIMLDGQTVWLETADILLQGAVLATPRIGISYAGDDALLPYRFVWKPQE